MHREVIIKELDRARLTITPTRVTIKVPPEHPDHDRIIKFADHVVEKRGPVEKSFRGRFLQRPSGRYTIQMADDKGHNCWYVDEPPKE